MKGRLLSHLVRLRSGQIRVAQLCPDSASQAHGGPPPPALPTGWASPPHEQRRQECAPAARVEGEGRGSGQGLPVAKSESEPRARSVFRKRSQGRLSAWLRLLTLPPQSLASPPKEGAPRLHWSSS
ncbi:unnamed protein product [Rangifer tarandus platyrhynchus]|uniref:Uncharacterized protein n=2 Tax=Rangifer tarandus platyrhynchus TaxID=3082113 RepID=A0ABN8ZIS1_RANTA|nr:unnamed protein product [Rangifer tarandus platyrhynchus]CAI9708710.1 unnamed protein product [Rangifer tarandus platyrhynchus]